MLDLTNKVLTIPKPKQCEIVERPYPKIVSGYLIIKTEIAPICLEGSRIWQSHDFEWHDDSEHLGHEGVGTVAEVLPGSKFKKGDRVIVFQGDHCGQCHACAQALSPTYCQRNLPEHGGRGLRGIEEHNESESGGFAMASYRIAPEQNVVKIPDSLDFRYAAAANCSFGVGYSNQQMASVKAGDVVLVGGVGFIGMGHIISALYANATVIVLIRNEYRKDLLKQMGVTLFVNPDDENWLDQVKSYSYNNQGLDIVIDGSGAPYYQQKLMQALRVYGTYIFSGHQPNTSLPLSPLDNVLDPAIKFFGQHDVRAIDRAHLIRALCNSKVQKMIDVMVTHEFPMSQAQQAFEVQASKHCGKIYLYTQW